MTAQIPSQPSAATTDLDLLEKIRQQFDSAPYPRIAVEESPKDDAELLYLHNLVTAYYTRNQRVLDTKNKVILDAGCGSGYKSLTLALANPDAKIIGIDISEESVRFAEKRLQYHGVSNAEFHVLLLEDLPKLGIKFDYVNCDDVLYLLPDAVAGLKAMKSVLAPEGIIRVNLHSYFQRSSFFRAQKLFKFMGLMDSNPEEMEIGIVRDIMNACRDEVLLKSQTWRSPDREEERVILANQLLVGDKGSTIPEFFELLRQSGLEFINMTNWQKWDLLTLFKEPDNLPAYLAMSLPELSQEEKLHLYELLNPVNRLLDLWCGHPEGGNNFLPIEEWKEENWQNAVIHIHPQLRTPKFREDLISSLTQMRAFEISKYLSLNGQGVFLDCSMTAILVPLLEQPQTMDSLVARWKKVRACDPVTLEPTEDKHGFYLTQQMLLMLEKFGLVMLELP